MVDNFNARRGSAFKRFTLIALLVLILGFAIVVNAVLGSLEQALHRRWYRS